MVYSKHIQEAVLIGSFRVVSKLTQQHFLEGKWIFMIGHEHKTLLGVDIISNIPNLFRAERRAGEGL